MDQALLIALRVLAGLDQLNQQDAFADLKADIAAFNAKVRERLPAKADGTSWTDADVEEALARANAPLDEIDQRHGGN